MASITQTAELRPAGRISRATLAGFCAILLWSVLALLTAATGDVPPFQLAGLTFAIASLVGLAVMRRTGTPVSVFRQPPRVWALGIFGLFGYHALYFAALRLAPPAEAGLIAYLWPLLIVLMASALPGERLSARHLIGAALGFAGVVVLAASRDGGPSFDPAHLTGYAAALGCALIWSSYSVLSRLMAGVPTAAVTGFCLATMLLSALGHVAFESTAWPSGAMPWLAVLGLGLGPVGAAFFLWDVGMKRGDIRLLGVASYATPVLSTLVLVLAGYAQPGLGLALACLLIVAGAVVATRTPGPRSSGAS